MGHAGGGHGGGLDPRRALHSLLLFSLAALLGAELELEPLRFGSTCGSIAVWPLHFRSQGSLAEDLAGARSEFLFERESLGVQEAINLVFQAIEGDRLWEEAIHA